MSRAKSKPAPARDQRDTDQWDRYWAYGNIHSFSQVSGGNYDGTLAALWGTCFQDLPEGARIVDIATGNGAIALLALEQSDRLSRRFDVCGTDLADIDPAGRVNDEAVLDRLKRIRFIGRTPAEALPFEDGSFDLVCSQFGVEYSDLSKTVPEVMRVLDADGRLALVMHHAGSVLLEATHRELEQLDFVLDDVKLYLRARNLLRAMAADRGGRPNPKTERKRLALREAMERIQKAADSDDNPHMLLGPARYIREIFAARERAAPGQLLEWLEEALHRVTANRRRLRDMVDAARDGPGIHDFTDRLRQAGFTGLRCEPFHVNDGVLLGWRVEARRS